MCHTPTGIGGVLISLPEPVGGNTTIVCDAWPVGVGCTFTPINVKLHEIQSAKTVDKNSYEFSVCSTKNWKRWAPAQVGVRLTTQNHALMLPCQIWSSIGNDVRNTGYSLLTFVVVVIVAVVFCRAGNVGRCYGVLGHHG